jgi:urea transporter
VGLLTGVVLRGIAQVNLQRSAWTGLLILAALFAFSWDVGVFGLIGVLVSTGVAYLLRVERSSIVLGMQGFSGCLTAIALDRSLGPHPATFGLAVGGAAACTLINAALVTMLRPWGLPPLTAPFCVVAGVMVVGAPAFARLWHGGTSSSSVTRGPSALSAVDFGRSLLTNVAEVFLLNRWYVGLIMLAGLFVAGWRVGLFAAAGSLAGTLIAWGLGAPATVVADGIYGYNAVLVAIALGVTFLPPGAWTAGYALAGVVIATALTASLTSFFQTFGGHTFTWPFVLTTWLLLAAVPALPRLHRR